MEGSKDKVMASWLLCLSAKFAFGPELFGCTAPRARGGAAWAKVATAQMGSTLCRQATENCHSQTVHPMRFPMYVVKVEVWVQLQNFIMNFSQHFQVFQ